MNEKKNTFGFCINCSVRVPSIILSNFISKLKKDMTILDNSYFLFILYNIVIKRMSLHHQSESKSINIEFL